jgi:16S rRNA (guanine527-N7)-methyltransferase
MTQLVKMLSTLGLDSLEEKQLIAFIELFEKWNASINLSAARRREDIQLHVIDSLHAVPHFADARRVVDVGSGGGLPVVVAAICLPSVAFTALEPVHKKHAFLRTAARELGLANLEAFAIRVEDLPKHDFDAASSRATFDLREWVELGMTLVRPAGKVIGFEAVQRDDLPAPFERHPYRIDGKSRAIIVARRPAMD